MITMVCIPKVTCRLTYKKGVFTVFHIFNKKTWTHQNIAIVFYNLRATLNTHKIVVL